MELQERQKLILTQFKGGATYDFGVASPNDKIEFEFEYSGEDFPIEGVEASCGCTDLRVEDGNKIKGVLSLGAKAAYENKNSTHFLDDDDKVWRVSGKVAIPTDPRLKPVPLSNLKGKHLPMEHKTFTVYFKDEEEFMNVDENKVVRKNANKTKVSLAIRGFVKV